MQATETSFAKIFTAAMTIIAAALFLGAIILPIIALKRWRGPWRFAAGLPLLVLLALAAIISISIMRDPTAHNLWPFELVVWGVASLIYLGALALLRRIFGAGEA